MFAKDYPQLGRVPPDIKDLLKAIAKENDRSLSQEVINRLRKSLREDGYLNA